MAELATGAGAIGDIPFLDRLPDEARRVILASATATTIDAGRPIFATDSPRAGIIETGVARVFLTSASGRQVTLAYPRAGALLANRSSLAGSRGRTNVEAVTACGILEIRASALLSLVRGDSAVAAAVVEELAHRLDETYAALAGNAFGSVRDRVAEQLLARARMDPKRGVLVVEGTQDQLALGVGSPREVVARVLRDMRVQGVISTAKREVVIRDAGRLASLVGRWRSRSGRHRSQAAAVRQLLGETGDAGVSS